MHGSTLLLLLRLLILLLSGRAVARVELLSELRLDSVLVDLGRRHVTAVSLVELSLSLLFSALLLSILHLLELSLVLFEREVERSAETEMVD